MNSMKYAKISIILRTLCCSCHAVATTVQSVINKFVVKAIITYKMRFKMDFIEVVASVT